MFSFLKTRPHHLDLQHSAATSSSEETELGRERTLPMHCLRMAQTLKLLRDIGTGRRHLIHGTSSSSSSGNFLLSNYYKYEQRNGELTVETEVSCCSHSFLYKLKHCETFQETSGFGSERNKENQAQHTSHFTISK